MSESIPLAKQREREAIQLVKKVLGAARELIANGMLKAAGYRVLVKYVEVSKGMEAAEMEQFPTLAEKGMETKSDKKRDAEERGEDHAIVMDLGPIAFARHGGAEFWCAVGDVVIINPYAGHRVEHPPGSKVWYQLLNDEDVFGRIE